MDLQFTILNNNTIYFVFEICMDEKSLKISVKLAVPKKISEIFGIFDPYVSK